ncbi:MAG: hypothetical protein AAF985_21920, partial [Bacteroidota bacterium]
FQLANGQTLLWDHKTPAMKNLRPEQSEEEEELLSLRFSPSGHFFCIHLKNKGLLYQHYGQLLETFEGQVFFAADGQHIRIEIEEREEFRPLPIEKASTADFPFQLLKKGKEKYKVVHHDLDNHLTLFHVCDLQDNRLFSFNYGHHFSKDGIQVFPAPDFSQLLVVGKAKSPERDGQLPNFIAKLYENPIVQWENGKIHRTTFEQHRKKNLAK